MDLDLRGFSKTNQYSAADQPGKLHHKYDRTEDDNASNHIWQDKTPSDNSISLHIITPPLTSSNATHLFRKSRFHLDNCIIKDNKGMM